MAAWLPPEMKANVAGTSPDASAMTKVPDILHLALEPKSHPSADTSAGSAALKRPSSKRTKLQMDISPNDDLENLARETQQLASEKESEVATWQLV